jgi:Putative Fe-S cluster
MRLEAAGSRTGRDAPVGEAGGGHGDRRWRRDEAGAWHPGFAWEFITPELLAHAVLPLLAGHETPAVPLDVAPAQAGRPAAAHGQTAELGRDVLRVTGVSHVIAVLEQMEDGLVRDVRVLEPYICDRGCFGSPLLPADPYLSEHAWLNFGPHPAALDGPPEIPAARPYAPRTGIRLDADMSRAVAKLARLQEVTQSLPGKDCGACGAPSCASLAEDVVMERATRESCPYLDEEVTP